MNNCKKMDKKCEYADRLGMCENITATCSRSRTMRLIDADKLKKAFCSHCDGEEPCTEPCIDIGLIETAPTIDADEKRIEFLQKLVDINTERCEELRRQLRDAHESYEKHINELEQQIPKHGEWIKGIHMVECSVCSEKFDFGDETWVEDFDICEDIGWKYCPNCGAKMDGEEKNDE